MNNTAAYLNLNLAARESWQGDLIISFTAPPFGVGTVGEVYLSESQKEPGRSYQALVSLGREDERTTETYREAGGAAAKWLLGNEIQNTGLDLGELTAPQKEPELRALLEGLILGAFRFRRYKSSGQSDPYSLTLLDDGTGANLAEVVSQTQVVAESVNLAREWAHEPPNMINPVSLAERVEALAEENGLSYQVLDETQLKEIGAGAILAVGAGSSTPSRLIVLEYQPESMTEEKPVVLVGKAITFDTGGYSLKDKTGMVGMKFDKVAGMVVIAVLQAAARLKFNIPVVGIIAAAENMVSASAYRPNDIITTLSGKTVEVISADAEGRLVLCDALTYAQNHYNPQALIDLATLTGGVKIALGSVRAGIMTNDSRLSDNLIYSGDRVGERLWQLPLDDEYFQLIKGEDSDLKNSASREAHTIVGGIFLKQFIDPDIPWAHLDIANVSYTEKDLPYRPKGATGFGVRLLLDYLEQIQE